MEQEIARRRVSRILDHVAVGSDHPPTPQATAHLVPMNCSSTLNTMVRRRDNRLTFARQGSAYQGYFMQQNTGSEVCSQQKLSHGRFCSGDKASFSKDFREPLFSRQTKTVAGLQDFVLPAHDALKFARKDSGDIDQQLSCSRSKEINMCNEMEWSPRIDVAESQQKYFITIELPGVTTSDIRVEVNDQSLIVLGKRSMHLLRVPKNCASVNATYHQKEILRGPYRVVWPLPNNVNKERVSAELVDGFLQIILPKL